MNLGQAYKKSSSNAGMPSSLVGWSLRMCAECYRQYATDSPSRHLSELLAVTLLDDIGDVVVYPRWRECVADREERIHAVSSLVYLHDGLDMTVR